MAKSLSYLSFGQGPLRSGTKERVSSREGNDSSVQKNEPKSRLSSSVIDDRNDSLKLSLRGTKDKEASGQPE